MGSFRSTFSLFVFVIVDRFLFVLVMLIASVDMHIITTRRAQRS